MIKTIRSISPVIRASMTLVFTYVYLEPSKIKVILDV